MKKGGIIIGLIYILSQKTYYDYYYRGIKRILPRSLIPIIKPIVIETIYDLDGNISGKICGIFLRDYPKEKDKIIENIIVSLENLKDEHINYIVLEDMFLFNNMDFRLIEERTNLKVLDGIKVLTAFLPIALKEIYKLLNEDIKTKEVLIIGDNEEQTKDIIEAICKDIRFITITGQYDRGIIDNIYKNILEKTGLSIFYSRNIDKILTNYSIIINLIDNYSIDFKKLRSEVIVFDFSINKSLSKSNLPKGKNVIEDFIFKKEALNIKSNKYFPEAICSRIYESLKEFHEDDLRGFYIDDNIYSIEEFVNKKIKNKGKL